MILMYIGEKLKEKELEKIILDWIILLFSETVIYEFLIIYYIFDN